MTIQEDKISFLLSTNQKVLVRILTSGSSARELFLVGGGGRPGQALPSTCLRHFFSLLGCHSLKLIAWSFFFSRFAPGECLPLIFDCSLARAGMRACWGHHGQWLRSPGGNPSCTVKCLHDVERVRWPHGASVSPSRHGGDWQYLSQRVWAVSELHRAVFRPEACSKQWVNGSYDPSAVALSSTP